MNPTTVTSEARALIEAVCDGLADDAQVHDLESLLLTDEKTRKFYVYLLDLDAKLQWIVGSLQEGDAARKEYIAADQEPPQQPAATFTATLLHSTIGYFSSGWPVAYLIATAVLAAGLLVAGYTYVSRPEQGVATYSLPISHHNETLAASVARVTAMADCRWDKSCVPLAVNASVRLGRQIKLEAGLMEISYDSGAKVILQGPVTYRAESPAGGFLSLGRLTARVENTKTKDPRPKTQDPISKSPNLQISKSDIPPPLFSVHTPTATVTDLGTEFGVEVRDSGITTAYVFRGVVEVQQTAVGGGPGPSVRLTESELVHVEGTNGEKPLRVQRGVADPSSFVRAAQLRTLMQEYETAPVRRWQAYSAQLRKDPTLVVYYPFESVGKDSWLLPNAAATGPALDAEIQGPLWTSGRLPGKVALRFRGVGTNDRVVLPDQRRFNFTKPFSVALWFQTAQFAGQSVPALIAKGPGTWRIERYGNDTNFITIDSCPVGGPSSTVVPRTAVIDGRWHLAVAVIELRTDSHRKLLYLDGRLDGEADIPGALRQQNSAVWLGAMETDPDRVFEGRIDEVMIFDRALSAEEITSMFNAGDPASGERR